MINNISLENFKGTTAQIDLKQLNIFRGTSGSGKSTWLEGVRVAIVGHDPGYGKLLSETMAFASGPRMSVAVSREDVSVKRIFEDKEGKFSQTVLINGSKMTKVLAEQEVAKAFGQFPMMLNPDEFFGMSDDKKITFLFGLSNTETNSGVIRRDCIAKILDRYTDAIPLILEYEFKVEGYHAMDDKTFDRLVVLAIEKLAKKDVEAGRALTKIFSEFLSGTFGDGQQTLSTYATVLKEEINATRRSKQDAEAANRKLMEEKTDKLKLVNYNDAENQREVEVLRKEISDIEKELHVNEKLRSTKEMLTSGLAQHKTSVALMKEELSKLEAELPSEADTKELIAMTYGYENANYRMSEQIFIAEVRRMKICQKLDEIKKLSEKATHKCAKCGGVMRCDQCEEVIEEEITEAFEDLKQALADLEEVDDYLEITHAKLGANDKEGLDVSSALADGANIKAAVDIARRNFKSVASLVKEQQESLDKIEEPGAGDEVLKAQVSGLKVSLGERLIAAKNHDWLRTLSATIAKANETIGNSTALLAALATSISEIKLVRDELTASATSTIEEVCNGLLQKVDDRFKLKYDIEDGKFDIRCVNVSGNEVPFKTLSGGEKVLYLSAQLLALMTIVNPELKILEVEMGELSGNLVPPFMDALESMTEGKGIQVVLSSCHRDFKVNTGSWAVHEMGE